MTNLEKRAVASRLKDTWDANWQYYYNENTSYNEFTTMLRKEFDLAGRTYRSILVGGATPGRAYYTVFKDVNKGLESPSFEIYFHNDGTIRVTYQHNYAEDLREKDPNHPSLKKDDEFHTYRRFLDEDINIL